MYIHISTGQLIVSTDQNIHFNLYKMKCKRTASGCVAIIPVQMYSVLNFNTRLPAKQIKM